MLIRTIASGILHEPCQVKQLVAGSLWSYEAHTGSQCQYREASFFLSCLNQSIHFIPEYYIHMGCLKKTCNFCKNDCNMHVYQIFECVIIVLSIYV